ncbi:hypothetical protein QBC37DRAFT_404754 [Rhypophila decipiens]|uniref:F-box domain-containing protein n=1 Tax=Rhypophila decipiens TaxID=261697 RepID=A0AAN7B5M3_9PEZI|nr:hypothetical protein QBC37DRAFT_404754 [Rhypophila decipiens]
MLHKLPPEIMEMISRSLTSKQDLKALALVSRAVHRGVQRTLWASLDLWTIQEKELWHLNWKPVFHRGLPALVYPAELSFNSDFSITQGERCPHWRDHEDPPDSTVRASSRFECLARTVQSIVENLPPRRLRKFTWGLGTCIPGNILGRKGILERQQPHLTSLDLTTAGDCLLDDEIDLSSFRNLRELRWRGPRFDDFDAIADVLRINRQHLTKVELDFVDWNKLRDHLAFEPDAEIDLFEGLLVDNFFHRSILGIELHTVIDKPIFPSLVSLSLSSVPLLGRTARAFDFSTLESLTLRKCRNWDRFLDEIPKLGVPIRLKCFEVHQQYDPQAATTATPTPEHAALLRFITSFAGLEDLYLSLVSPIDTLELWEMAVKSHGSTLKRFTHHLCGTVSNSSIGTPGSHIVPHIYDIPDFDLAPRLGKLTRENPLSNICHPESIGLTCIPEVLGPIFSSFARNRQATNSLKLIHVRQSIPHAGACGNWTGTGDPRWYPMILLPDSYHGNPHTTDRYPIPLSASLYGKAPGLEQEVEWAEESDQIGRLAIKGPRLPEDEETESKDNNIKPASSMNVSRLRASGLRDAPLRFADWAFGPNGIPSLDVIAFGDFGHGRWESNGWGNLFLIRNKKIGEPGADGGTRAANGGDNFSVFWPCGKQLGDWSKTAASDLIERNRRFLEACPMESLVDYDESWPF